MSVRKSILLVGEPGCGGREREREGEEEEGAMKESQREE